MVEREKRISSWFFPQRLCRGKNIVHLLTLTFNIELVLSMYAKYCWLYVLCLLMICRYVYQIIEVTKLSVVHLWEFSIQFLSVSP